MTTIIELNREELQARHYDSVIGRALETLSLIKYHQTEIIPFYDKMANWEKKEYVNNYETYVAELADQVEYIKEMEDSFNNMLSEYNITVAQLVEYLTIK